MIIIILNDKESNRLLEMLERMSNNNIEEELIEIKKRIDRIVREFTLRISDHERRLMKLEGKPLYEEGEEDEDRI